MNPGPFVAVVDSRGSDMYHEQYRLYNVAVTDDRELFGCVRLIADLKSRTLTGAFRRFASIRSTTLTRCTFKVSSELLIQYVDFTVAKRILSSRCRDQIELDSSKPDTR